MSLFDRLQKSRGQQAEAFTSRLAQQGQAVRGKDPRIWKWSWNKAGVSENIIRFLPIPMVDMKRQESGEISVDAVLTPVAMIIRHSFQGPGGWYVANSPQTFGEDDPVRDHDRPLWGRQKETNDEALKNKLKDRLPDTKYYANILVIQDTNSPENNGQVRLIEFGPAIKKLLDLAQNPKFSTDAKFDPYDPWEGANLTLNLIGEERSFNNWTGLVPKFDNAKWQTPAPMGDDKFIEEIWEKEHSLYEFYDPKNFETYAQLETRLRKVLQIPQDIPLVEHGLGGVAHAPVQQAQSQPRAQAEPVKTVKEDVPAQQTTVETKQPETAAASGGGAATIDDFEQYLKNAQ